MTGPRQFETDVVTISPRAIRVGWAPGEERVILQFMVGPEVVSFSFPASMGQQVADGILKAIRDGESMRPVQ